MRWLSTLPFPYQTGSFHAHICRSSVAPFAHFVDHSAFLCLHRVWCKHLMALYKLSTRRGLRSAQLFSSSSSSLATSSFPSGWIAFQMPNLCKFGCNRSLRERVKEGERGSKRVSERSEATSVRTAFCTWIFVPGNREEEAKWRRHIRPGTYAKLFLLPSFWIAIFRLPNVWCGRQV